MTTITNLDGRRISVSPITVRVHDKHVLMRMTILMALSGCKTVTELIEALVNDKYSQLPKDQKP